MICDKLLGIPLFILLSCTYTYRPILAFRRDGVEKRIYPNSGGSSLPLRNAVEYRPPPSFDYSFNEQHLTRDAPMVPHVPYQQLKYSPDIPDSQLYTSTWWAKKSSAVRSPDPENGKNIYCFYESWSAYRKPPAAFSADNIDPFLCTHILYAFARVNSHSNKLVPVDEEYDIVKGGYRSIVFLKRTNPRLKILLSVGGPLSNMTSTAANRRTFILSAVRMLQEYGFDGLDLHWEFPGAEDLGGRKEDKEHLSQLVEEMSDIFEARGLILVASVSPSRFRLEDGYDVPRLSQHLKHILLKSFDFHNERNGGAVHHSPLTANSEQDPLALYFNVDYAVRYWLKRGVKREQLILGIPFYGRSYTLKHSSKWTPGSPTLTTGKESRYTQQPGFMAYYEVCEQINDDSGEWRLFRDNAGAPFMVMDDQWVGYEDPVSIQIKAKYLRQQGLGGAMIWSVDLDDFHGRCGQRYPLLTTIKAELDPKSYNNAEPDFRIYKKNKPPKPDLKASNPRVVCYFTNWAWYRKGDGKFYPEHIPSSLCTDVIYAFASLDPNDFVIRSFDTWSDIDNNFYARVMARAAGDANVYLSMGGWTDSAGDKYSKLVGDSGKRKKFIDNVMQFLRRHSFDGLHIDWNYPVCWQSNCKKGPSSDKPNFTKFIQEIRSAFNKERPPLKLSASVSGYKEIIERAYDMRALGKELDFITVMTFDYHGAWEKETGHVAPLYGEPNDLYPDYNVDSTMKFLQSIGADKSKLVVGIPFYGQSFTLESPDRNSIGDGAIEPGDAGEYTKQPGMLAYYEICEKVKKNQWITRREKSGPYATYKDQWVSYDDPESVKEKVRYVKSNGFGGVMAWTLDLDDYNNKCCLETFPLLKSINREFGYLSSKQPTGDCSKPPTPSMPPTVPTTTTEDTGEFIEVGGTTSSSTTSSSTTISSTTVSTTTTPSTTQTWWKPETTKPTTEQTWWTKPTETTTVATSSTTTTTTQKPKPPSRPTSTSTTSTTERPTSMTEKPTPTTVDWKPITSKPTTTQSSVIPESCNTGDYKPVEGDCNAYYRCILGEYRKEHCAGSLHWNSNINVCDWPENVKCKEGISDGSSSTTQSSSSSSTSTSTERPDEWWTPPTMTWWSEATTPKPIITTSTKEPSTWWSPDTKPTKKPSTTTPFTTTTAVETPTTPSPPAPAVTLPPCNHGQYYPIAGSCNKFAVCLNGALIAQQCGPGLYWNQQQSMCDWSYNVDCKENVRLALQWWNLALTQGHGNTNTRIADESGCSRGQFAPHPTNCNKYLQCQWGLYEIYSCPPSLHWNANRQICDWPQSKDGTCALSPGEPGGETESTESNVIPSSKPTPSTSTVSTTTQQEWTWVPPSTTEWSWTTPKPKPKPPKQPTPPHPTLSGYYKVVCYFTNWAWYRQGIGKYLPEDIDGNLCTHVLYGFSVLDSENLIIKAHDSWADFDNRFYERVVAMREKGIKVLLALGGWNDSLGDKYSRLVNNAAARQRFVQHALQFLLKYDFDGLDLDWEYPKCWQVNCEKGPDSDKQNFGLFVKEIKDAFRPHDLLLSAAVSPSKAVIDAGYDVKALAENLDWISVMTYDYHGQWDKKTGHVAPMYYHPDDEYDYFNANFSLNYWISEGVPPRKLVMGMPMYGQSFRLADSANHGLNALAPGPGEAGEQTRAAGFLAYYEICDKIKNGGWTVVKDEERRMGPYAYKGDQWVSFDDQEMIKYKSEFIREMGLGGGMIWALDLDDFRNTCGGGTHPLLKIIANTLSNPPDGVVLPKPSTTTRKPHNVTESTTAITMTTTEMTDNMSEEIYAVGYKSKQNLDVLCYLQPNFAGCKNHSRK